MAQGPGKIAKISAKVTIKQPQVTRNVDDSITFDIHIPCSSTCSSTCESTSSASRSTAISG